MPIQLITRVKQELFKLVRNTVLILGVFSGLLLYAFQLPETDPAGNERGSLFDSSENYFTDRTRSQSTNQVSREKLNNIIYDVIISNGKIIDGSGNPWFYGDIGIISGKIVKTGCLNGSNAKQFIDASGMFVTPGFIDIHTHSDNEILNIPTADNSVHQGLTTIVAGNCGGSPLPVGVFLDKVRNTGISINYITLAGHGSIRRKAMGGDNRKPSPAEMNEMKRLMAAAMEEGAFGISTGLYYTPGNYADTDEIIELAKVVAQYRGIYVSHLRDESDYNIGVLAAVEEAIRIGEAANLPVQISHLKCLGKPVWHKSDEILELIYNARIRGVDVRFDQYPYTASNTSLWGAVIPAWAQESGTKMFLKRLEDPATNEKLREGIQSNISRRGGAQSLFILKEKRFLSEMAVSWDLDPVDAVVRIIKEGGSSVISFNMTDYDLEKIIQSPFGMIGSDGSISSSQKAGHPRAFGTFPRVFEVYVKEKQLLSWEEAVRKMTSAPANQLGLSDRGMIRTGMIADIVVFNPETIRARADYENPGLFPEGIDYVFVNGIAVINKGEHTGARAGKVLIHKK